MTITVANVFVDLHPTVPTAQNVAVTTQLSAIVTTKGLPLAPAKTVQKTAPQHGTISIDLVSGAVTYHPTPGYSGPDDYVITVCDTGNVCHDSPVAVTVAANVVDAKDDSASTTVNVAVTTDVRTNDTSASGQPLANPTIVTNPAHGTVIVNGDGTITYTPAAGWFGVDSYLYRVCDTSTPTPVCDTATVTVTVPVPPNPALTVVKSASPSDAAHFTVGQVVTYSFVITNTGNVTLTNVHATEGTFTGSGTLSAPTCPAGAASLAPAAQVTCTASYTVTQADIDGGTVSNTATATGTPPAGDTTPVSPPSTVTIPGNQNPAITVVKTATPTTLTAAGQTVTYSFLVTNTGNVTLTNATVTETAFTGSGTAPTISCPAGAASLLPGAQVTCAATYVATQADVDAGSISNTATVTATPPAGVTAPVSPPSTATVTATPGPAITLLKSATPSTITAAGQTVSYSFLVTNTGNVTLTNAAVTDTAFTGSGTPPTISCPAGAASLAPGCTGDVHRDICCHAS